MDIEKMLKAQEELDQRIYDRHGLEPSGLFKKKLIALLVELGEMANEARFFKYWSDDQDPRQELLEEYVDGLHFFLSLALLKGWGSALVQPGTVKREQRDIEDVYLDVIVLLAAVKIGPVNNALYNGMDHDEMSFHLAWSAFLEMGTRYFGFSEREIEAAYYVKNETNHQRQAGGY